MEIPITKPEIESIFKSGDYETADIRGARKSRNRREGITIWLLRSVVTGEYVILYRDSRSSNWIEVFEKQSKARIKVRVLWRNAKDIMRKRQSESVIVHPLNDSIKERLLNAARTRRERDTTYPTTGNRHPPPLRERI